MSGVIENMAWFTGDDGTAYELFGRAAAPSWPTAWRSLLGQVPLVPALREGGDAGAPIVFTHPDDEAAIAFRSVAERLDA